MSPTCGQSSSWQVCRKEWAERARRADHGFSVDTACETIDPTTLERAKVSCAVCLGALLFACLACQAAYDLNAKSGCVFSKGSDDKRHAAEGYFGKRHGANGKPCFPPSASYASALHHTLQAVGARAPVAKARLSSMAVLVVTPRLLVQVGARARARARSRSRGSEAGSATRRRSATRWPTNARRTGETVS